MDQHLIIADTETAGLDGGVCDFAAVIVDCESLEVVASLESLIDPERPISPQASGIHHITNAMVQHEPTLSEFFELKGNPFDNFENPIICGHNIAFDIRVLAGHIPPQHRRLCTLKLTRELWPDLEDHKLQTIRYTFDLDAGTAHRAMGDVMACLSLLRLVRDERGLSVAQMLDIVRRPLSLDSKITFGKHKGTKLRDLPSGWVSWLLKQDSVDPELRAALKSR